MAVVTIVMVVLTTLAIVLANWWFSVHGRLFRDKSLPVPPIGGLLLGHANATESMYGESGVQWFAKWGKIYPKIFRFRLGWNNFVVTSHPQYIKALFKDKPEKTWYYDFALRWLGDGLLFSKGNKWFTRRKLLTPSFHFDILKSYIDIFNETTNTMVEQLKGTSGAAVEIFPKALSLTLDTILRCLVNYETNCQTEYHEYAQLMYRISEIVVDRMFSPLRFPNAVFHPTPTGAEYRRLRKRFMDISRKIIEDRKGLHEKNPGVLEDVKNLNFLDVLLTVKYDDGTNLTVEEVLEEVNVFIFEGHDTTASGISWSLFQLAQHREHLDKCYQEIREVFDAEDGDNYVSQQQINALSHFSMCIKECLRLKSPVPYLGRAVAKDFTVDGHSIPKGASMMVMIDVLHQLEEFWDDPQDFIPERFSPENSKNRDPYTYIPFSVGNRNCIGQNFAVTELKMTVAKIIYNFDIVADKPEQVTRLMAMIQKPLNLNLKFIPRKL